MVYLIPFEEIAPQNYSNVWLLNLQDELQQMDICGFPGKQSLTGETQEFVPSLTLSPNPADDLVKLSMNIENAGIMNISVFDINGNQVMNVINGMSVSQGQFEQSLSVGSLANGVYNVVVNINGVLHSIKLNVNK